MTDLEIAAKHQMKPIEEIAKTLGVDKENVEPYGKYRAKITTKYDENPKSELILVTATNPTPYGEGKTTISIGLADGLSRIGKKTCLALREPSLGPVFGIKGGAAGGGYSQVVPMADINLHFNGDLHAVTAANNLLSALIDNHIMQSNALEIEEVIWRRCMDMNDRALRQIEVALGPKNGVPRMDGFDITAASEVMSIFCLATDIKDLKRRLGNIVVGYNKSGGEVYAKELKAENAMTILLSDALYPNLVQTLGGTPALIHGGPFANIAHGCNTVIATKTAMTLADYTVTEAGFGADLGAEKFMDIKCRKSNLTPSAVVIVTTARALKYNGGVAKESINSEDLEGLKKGLCNLEKHIENIQKFGITPVVAINKFTTDTEKELEIIKEAAKKFGATAVVAEAWAKGGEGCEELAREVIKACENKKAFNFLYSEDLSVVEKLEKIASEIYGAGSVVLNDKAKEDLKHIEKNGKYNKFPVCVAKTQYSLSADAKLLGRPQGYVLEVKELKIRGGAEFIVAVCGAIMLMPGLSKEPAATKMTIDENRNIEGLF
ncbi:MAG TPA: formate--tetrahydrofolate ligase [Clostridia bacterium]|jgi:formate--tetrahydrofolate ligase|nr:formate--tetrahydrofolate ligase [Clostridia bacterium]